MPSTLTEETEAVLLAAIGGARYGIKIRMPHAVIMTLIFRQDLSPIQKIETILRLTWEHASSLASFAALYKTILAVLKYVSKRLRTSQSVHASTTGLLQWMGRVVVEALVGSGHRLVESSPGYPERSRHALIAGAIGGYVVWGRYSKINVQINLYLFSRVVLALSKRCGWNVEKSTDRYACFSGLLWAVVMFLFEEDPSSLHSSLRMSMDEIYRFNAMLPSKPNQ